MSAIRAWVEMQTQVLAPPLEELLAALFEPVETPIRWRLPTSSGVESWAGVRSLVDRVGSARAGYLIVEPADKPGDTYRWAQCTGGSRTPLLVEVGFDSGVGIVAPAGAPSAEPVVVTNAGDVWPHASVADPNVLLDPATCVDVFFSWLTRGRLPAGFEMRPVDGYRLPAP
jgi:hypothetical protein